MLILRFKSQISNSFTSYDRFLLRAIVIVAYLGWAAYAALFVFRPPEIPSSAKSRGPFVTVILISVMLILWGSFFVQKSPWTFYVYVTFPCYFWNQVLLHAVNPVHRLVRERGLGSYGRFLLQASLVICILQCMVVGIYQLYFITFHLME
jgi:GPI ethanolamine phosphate transferase 1